jgi:hypothetical protein
MTKKKRLVLIRQICESRKDPIGIRFAPTEEDIKDEIERMPCRPDAPEPNEEFLLFMDEAFEGGQ